MTVAGYMGGGLRIPPNHVAHITATACSMSTTRAIEFCRLRAGHRQAMVLASADAPCSSATSGR